ncbi:MAG: ATP synthase F0 subunit B [Acidobacteria bacterium]|nr:ATP synthase F0 subunit B [Acidobacteriota bacterium]MBI3426698.1 ATP synthase F0 subunit B [Acidobacteriota bacterium]
MKSITQLRSLIFTPVLFAPPVLLAEGLHPAIPKAVNLAVFLTVLYLLVRKPAREFFAERLATVRATLDRAANEKAEATAKLNELNARLSKLDAEVTEIRAQAEREALAERERLQAEARADAEKLRTTANREIEGAKQAALVQLREFTADKAVELAEQMIRRELTPQDDARLLQRVSEELSKVS